MVEYFGRLNGMEGEVPKSALNALFDVLSLNEFRDGQRDKLSTGQKQKVSIALILIHDPAVMIFDEPTIGLDVMTARTIIGFIRHFRDRGKTVIFPTHVMSEVGKLVGRVGIIHNGRVMAEGTLAELRESYKLHDLEDIFVTIVGDTL